jgi:hypothetical protein
MVLHASQTIKVTSTQDLDPLPLANNNHPSLFFSVQFEEVVTTILLTFERPSFDMYTYMYVYEFTNFQVY